MKRAFVGRTFLLIWPVLWWAGCASERVSGSSPVRRIYYRGAAELKPLAQRALHICNDTYPKLCALLAEDAGTAPRRFDIIFTDRLPGNSQAGAAGGKLYLNTHYLKTNDPPAEAHFEQVLIHEMAHVAQNYDVGKRDKIPSWWVEGMADYARYKLGHTNGPAGPECSAEYPHYKYGYQCAGAFLLHLEASYGPMVVRRLHRALHQAEYSDELFLTTTGKPLDDLWMEFQNTSAFKPIAKRIYKLHNELGYVNGKPPDDLGTRTLAWLKDRPGGPLTLDAANFLKGLIEKDQLPGVVRSKKKKHKVSFTLGLELDDALKQVNATGLPASRTFYGQRSDEAFKIFYRVNRVSEEGPWKLERAWRAAPDGQLLEEYRVE